MVEEVTVGVPEMTPVVVLKLKPVGKLGAMETELTELPNVGVMAEMAEFLVKVKGEPATEIVGAA